MAHTHSSFRESRLSRAFKESHSSKSAFCRVLTTADNCMLVLEHTLTQVRHCTTYLLGVKVLNANCSFGVATIPEMRVS